MGCCGNIKTEKGELVIGEGDVVRPSTDISKIIATKSTEENEAKRISKVLVNNFQVPIMKQSVLSEQTGTEDDIELIDLPLPEESYMENRECDTSMAVPGILLAQWKMPIKLSN
ncbi:unnamed protein product [Blepharisma stoltei]|uniref:Uncharacterized protein n=1 Tax=Blepharisma stoltei TaxID=1481888 RepID=A0AAU9KFE1_9CILI|nr:unnamed protein product [Blepharisma stoltei]